MAEIKLSICIATFNRGAFIGETLDSIAPQCPQDVEIVVVDGASADNTEQIVKGYQRRFPCLRYVRQEKNRGVDEDFFKAVSLARGEYCWLMSDDDLLKPEAVSAVLKEIKKDYGLIIVNAEVRSADLSIVLDSGRLAISEDRVYVPSENETFFSDTAQFLSFIGCVVIKRELWEQREKEKYFGTVFIHVGVIFQSPIPGGTLVIAKPLISIRYGNAQWSARGFEIWMFKWPALIWSFSGFSDSAKTRVCAKEPWRKVLPLIGLRALGVFSIKEYRKWVRPRVSNILLKVVIVLICATPALIFNALGIIYFGFFRPSPLKVVDLKKSSVYWRNVLI